MRLSISSYAGGNNPEEAVMRMVKAGFKYAELDFIHCRQILNRSVEEQKKFRQFAENAGLKFHQGHLPGACDITDVDEKVRLENVETHKNFCRMFHIMGISNAVLHCGGYKEILDGGDPAAVRERRVKSLASLIADLPENMNICLENLPYETFEDVNANLAQLGYPDNLGFCLDTGHLNFSPEPDQGNYIRKAGKRLKALHLHDNAGPVSTKGAAEVLPISGWNKSDKHMFPGFFYGSINWYTVIEALDDIGYDGYWNLEISADFFSNIPHDRYRELVLRQDRERGEMLFSFDPDAPGENDPVNDFKAIKKIVSGGVSAETEKYSIKISAPSYTLYVDTVHGARINRWKAFGREIVKKKTLFGWAIPGIWNPCEAGFFLRNGVKFDSLKAVENGIELITSRVLTAQDNPTMAGCTFVITDLFTADSFTRKVTMTNDSGKILPRFAFRFHSMPDILGGKNLPAGEVVFADGMKFNRDFKQHYFRINEEALSEAAIYTEDFVEAETPDLSITAPDVDGKLEITYPYSKLDAVFFWDNADGTSSFEPVYSAGEIAPGESCSYSLAVKHINF